MLLEAKKAPVGIEEKVVTLEKRASETKDSFAEMARAIEECEASLKVNEAQLGKVMREFQAMQKKVGAKIRDVKLI